MMKIVAIGKKSEPWLKIGLEGYNKRLQGRFEVEWVILPNSGFTDARACENESKLILSRLKADDYVILLDERGKALDSIELSDLLIKHLSQPIVFIIGGAYGVDQTVKDRANYIWSLSRLVFPHQVVRLVLTEQVYRSQTILSHHPYHHK